MATKTKESNQIKTTKTPKNQSILLLETEPYKAKPKRESENITPTKIDAFTATNQSNIQQQ